MMNIKKWITNRKKKDKYEYIRCLLDECLATGRNELDERFASWRHELWEDDFSTNNLDERPFENRPPISSHGKLKIDRDSPYFSADSFDGLSLDEIASRDPFPIPCGNDREGYMSRYDDQYWLSGLGDYFKVMRAANENRIETRSILDFGCASGRVTRHFCAQSDIPEIWGTDLNRRHIRWLSQFMPRRLKPIFHSCMPSLPIPDESQDIVCAFSVFTHIDTFETAWIAELRRILKPGGMCYLTIHNEDTWQALRELDASNRLLKSMRVSGKFTMDQLEHPMPGERLVYRFTRQGPYRSQVFHSNRYIENTWGRFFDLQQILPRHHILQSVVIMTKPQVAEPRVRVAA